MGRDANSLSERIDAKHLTQYLRARGYDDAVVTALAPLGQAVQEGLKDYGYGRPLRVTFTSHGSSHDLVVRTMAPDPFGHDRRADRASVLMQAFDNFNHIPEHIQALDIGAFDDAGMLVAIPHGEIFLVTNYVEGTLYAHDLHGLRAAPAASAQDRARAETLARYLVTLHGQPAASPMAYLRELRDTVGSGEGIFGICDSYPPGHPVASAKRLEAIEIAALRWRWRLRSYDHRARRTHGDFHPFNLLFREGTDFSVLDCSRGGEGEPADDVTCLSINYLFFALTEHQGRFEGPLRQLWDTFWSTYLEASGDREMLSVVAPFFAWRGLVLASPVWYPGVDDAVRDQLLTFVERLLEGAAFHPDRIDELLI